MRIPVDHPRPNAVVSTEAIATADEKSMQQSDCHAQVSW
jgi:hypothetical protein